MKTEYRLAAALKSMMESQPLDKISVVELAKKCKIKRQTFYYYFHDVYGLLTLVFLLEKINKIEDACGTKDMLTKIFEYYTENNKFIDASLNSGGKDLVNEFLFNNCYQTILRCIAKSKYNDHLTIKEKKDIARYFASAYASAIIYYLLTTKNKTINSYIKSIAFADDELIMNSIKKVIKSHPVKKPSVVTR